MNRRSLLKSLGLGVSAGAVMPSLFSSCLKQDPGPEVSYDGTVAIIGAGAAGLYAADILRAKGINVYVLEASSQLGGRIRSLKSQTDYQKIFGQETALEFGSDFPIELGAESYYGSDSNWGKIIQNYSIPTVEITPSTADRYILESKVKAAADWQSDSDFKAVQNFVSGLRNYTGAGQTMAQAAAISQRGQNLLNAQAGNFFGSNSDKIGVGLMAADLKLRKHDGKRMLVKANPMQDVLLSRFSEVQSLVQTNKPIVSINYSGDRVVMRDKAGAEYQANKVIVTVPLSILKAGSIAFSPGLPTENNAAMTKFGMDAAMRFVVDFKKNLWGESTGNIWGGVKVPQILNAGVGRSAFYRTLSISVHGNAAATLSAMGREDQLNAVLAELDMFYAAQASPFVRRDLNTNKIIAAIQDWSKDEFTKGGFSYPLAAASPTDRENLSKPVDNKIFFAGEATDVKGDAGTISGALASAERVSVEIVKSIVSS